MEGIQIDIINMSKQHELEDGQILKITGSVESFLYDQIDTKIREFTDEDPKPASEELIELSKEIHEFYLSYYSQFGISDKFVNKPEMILTARPKETNTNFSTQDLALNDVILLGEFNDDEVGGRAANEFSQALSLAHEHYHITASDQFEVVVLDVIANESKVKVSRVKSGLGLGETVGNSALEEGLAVRMEEVVNIKVFSDKFNGRSASEFHREHKDPDLKHSRSLVFELENNVPGFIRLAERARILDEVDELVEAIDVVYGAGTGEKTVNCSISNAADVSTDLFEIRYGKRKQQGFIISS